MRKQNLELPIHIRKNRTDIGPKVKIQNIFNWYAKATFSLNCKNNYFKKGILRP